MPGKIEMMFPVSIAVVDVDPWVREETRAKVYAYMDTERGSAALSASPIESVETSYFTSGTFLQDAGLDSLQKVILDTGHEFMRYLGANDNKLAFERSWINFFRPGMQEMQHEHDGSVMSGAYYVEAPEKCGDFYIPDPIGARRSHRAWSKTGRNTMQSATEVTYSPQTGRFLMFESWMPHAVLNNKSDKTRISIAFNLRLA